MGFLYAVALVLSQAVFSILIVMFILYVGVHLPTGPNLHRIPLMRPLDYLLHIACVNNCFAVAKVLVACGADLQSRGFLGETALFTVCSRDDAGPLATWIMAHKVGRTTVNQKSRFGKYPLDVALARCDHATVRQLLQHGAYFHLGALRFALSTSVFLDSKLHTMLQNLDQVITDVPEWRPWLHRQYLPPICDAVQTLAVLAKAAVVQL